ncbi:MAG: hypothetical protein E6K34_01070 [Gammaproteobacteria bacterium]|nr:MAG: hypothetical protein E6K34_01070 [Gammaproteobacteria bacterium]TLZ47111.1 MAG: hypothetical protein E6K21_14435 [Gammaproteobacteria bacterium]
MTVVRITDECKRIIQDHYGLKRQLTHTELVAEVKRLVRKWGDGSIDYRAEHLYFRLDLAGAFSATTPKSTRP